MLKKIMTIMFLFVATVTTGCDDDPQTKAEDLAIAHVEKQLKGHPYRIDEVKSRESLYLKNGFLINIVARPTTTYEEDKENGVYYRVVQFNLEVNTENPDNLYIAKSKMIVFDSDQR